MKIYEHLKLEKIRQPAEAEELSFAVYALHNKEAGKIYIGQTRDLENRIILHNTHMFKGYTSRFRGEWKIIFTQFFSTRQEALIREKQLKSFRGREFIRTKI